jgi:serine protease Do
VTGAVIGVNSMVSGGLGLAVPSNAVQWFLQNQGSRPQLGVTMQPVQLPTPGRGAGRPGLLVLDVAAGSPAERAGVIVGDVLIGVDGRLFEEPNDLLRALQGIGTQSAIRLELLRGGVRLTREALLLPSREASKGAAA